MIGQKAVSTYTFWGNIIYSFEYNLNLRLTPILYDFSCVIKRKTRVSKLWFTYNITSFSYLTSPVTLKFIVYT